MLLKDYLTDIHNTIAEWGLVLSSAIIWWAEPTLQNFKVLLDEFEKAGYDFIETRAVVVCVKLNA